MTYPLVRDLAADGIPVTVTCRVLKFSPQFRSRPYVSALHAYGLVGSMGRVASSAYNAAMESFFALVQKNVLNSRRWTTRAELRLALVTWIETTYHRRRRQRALGKTTPIEFETIYWPAHAA